MGSGCRVQKAEEMQTWSFAERPAGEEGSSELVAVEGSQDGRSPETAEATVAGTVSLEGGGGEKYLQKKKRADCGGRRVQHHECQEGGPLGGGGEQC